MKSALLKIKIVAISCLIISGTTPLWGQESENKDENVLMLEEMTVSVSKYEEKAAEVSASLTTISENEIAERDIESIEDIDESVPSLYIYNSGMPAYENKIGMRGHVNQRVHIDPALVIYIDDMPLTMYTEFSAGFFDAEKIEVLRGPQGTLYGVNAESGIINITTETNLDNEWAGKVGAAVGSFNQRVGKLKLSGPIAEDSFYLNASFGKHVTDGYITNKYNDEPYSKQDLTNYRVKLNWLFLDSLDFQLISYQTEQDNKGGTPYVQLDYKDAGLEKYEIDHNTEGINKSKTLSNAFKINWSTDNFLVKSITTMSDHEASYINDFDGTSSETSQNIGTHYTTNDTLTQELRISSPDNNESDFKWVVGASHSSGERTEDAFNDLLFGGVWYLQYVYDNKLLKKDQSIFAQASYKLFNQKLGLTAGARSETAKREIDANAVSSSPAFGGAYDADAFKDNKSESKTLHKATIEYKITEDVKVFATNATGWRAGGFNYIPVSGTYYEYDSEHSTTNELGLKLSFEEQKLVFSAVYFSTEINDFQVQLLDAATNYIYLSNAEQSEMSGLEIEALVAPLDMLDISFNYSQINAKFTDYEDNGTDYSGNKVPHTPTHEAYLGVKIKPLENFFVKFEAINNGMFYFDRTNDDEGKQDAITTYNMVSQYKIGELKLAASIKNLTNEYYYTDGMNNTTLGWVGIPAAPMTAQLKAEYAF